MKLNRSLVYWLSTVVLLFSLSCQVEPKRHLIISEGLDSLSSVGVEQSLLFHPKTYSLDMACLFDGRMTFEQLEIESTLYNPKGQMIKCDTLTFDLAKRTGRWCDDRPFVHQAKANRILSHKFPFIGIYRLRLRLLGRKNLKGILALSLDLKEEPS